MLLHVLLASAFHLLAVSAATINLDWNITWVLANPDGLQERPVIGINGQWPPPVLNFTKGDRIVANVYNGLGNESTSIHWHGMYQNGTNYMDGAPGVTQCQIAPGATMIYNFTLDQTGTYWYHSHTRGQYPDGLRQALLIEDPMNPYAGQYDVSHVITLSDWYHEQMPTLLGRFLAKTNPTGAEPVPKAALMNDTQNLTLSVESGKTYLFHLVNIGAFATQYFWIEDHTMKIVEVDGIWTEAVETSIIQISSAQRYSVLVTMKNDTSRNFAMVGSMDTDLFDTIPASLNPNVTGWLVYNKAAENPAPTDLTKFNPYDDFNLLPMDGLGIFPDADYTVTLDLTMNNLGDGANYAFFNGISYTTPVVPTLYSVLSSGVGASNPLVYGTYTNPHVLNKDSIVDIVLNNDDKGKHPFHLHGHAFQVIYRSDQDAGHFDPGNHSAYPNTPMRRDTVAIRPGGNFVLRFKADNPGIWLFHCHIQWHMDAGLAATMIEAPFDIQKKLSIPENHYQVCNASGTQISGNAAGNKENFLDLTGEPEQVANLPKGFTARGIVALVFSCLAAIVGLVSIFWYGTASTSSAITTLSSE